MDAPIFRAAGGRQRQEDHTAMESGCRQRLGGSPADVDRSVPQDHELRFNGVRHGESSALPLAVKDRSGLPRHLEVIVPPFAPFSVVERRVANKVRPDGRWSGDHTKKLWIRYDATSPMAMDTGRLVVRDPFSGRTWTVALTGTGELAPGL